MYIKTKKSWLLNRTVGCVAVAYGLLTVAPAWAVTTIAAGDLTVTVNDNGKITSMAGSNGIEYLGSGKTPALLKFIITDTKDSEASTASNLLPTAMTAVQGEAGAYSLTFAHDISAKIVIAANSTNYASMELTEVNKGTSKDIRAVMWGPYETSITAQVADTVGVAYNRDFAIGLIGANFKTIGGAPIEYNVNYMDDWIQGSRPRSRVSRNHYAASPGVITNFGSILQSFTRDFTEDRQGQGFFYDPGYRLSSSREELIGTDPTNPSQSHINLATVAKVEDNFDDNYGDNFVGGGDVKVGQMAGSKVALFGVSRQGEPSYGGEKKRFTNNLREVMKKEILLVIEQIEIGEGLPRLTQDGGQYAKLAEGSIQRYYHSSGMNSSSVGAVADRALDLGMRAIYDWSGNNGVFTDHTANSTWSIRGNYGGSVSSLATAIDAANTKGVSFGTHTLTNVFPGGHIALPKAESVGRELANKVNGSDLGFVSMDGVERYSNDPHGIIAKNIYLQSFYDNLDSSHKEMATEASVMNQFSWHTVNRLSWGEFKGHVLSVMARYRVMNSIYNTRNFLPPSLAGYWLGSGSNVSSPSIVGNGINEAHWLGSKVASWDSQFFLRSSGVSGTSPSERTAIKSWLNATESGAFSDRDRLMMNHWLTTASLDDVVSGKSWRLWDRSLNATFTNKGDNYFVSNRNLDGINDASDISNVSYGLRTNPRYIARPWTGHPAVNIAGNASVTTSSVQDTTVHGDKAVDGFAGANKSEVRHSPDFDGISEWAAASTDSSPWITLTWDTEQQVEEVILFDRASFLNETSVAVNFYPPQDLVADNVTSGELVFSDGTTQSFAALPIKGEAMAIKVPNKKTTSVRVNITNWDGNNPGLAEIGVIARAPQNVLGNLARNAQITAPFGAVNSDKLQDGELGSESANLGQELKNVTFDLGSVHLIDGLNVRHNAQGNRTYEDVIYQLSSKADFSDIESTPFNNDTNNSPGQGAGNDSEFLATSSGHSVFFEPQSARYVRIWSNGSDVDTSNEISEVEIYGKKDLASGITPTSSVSSTALISRVTDGDDSSYWAAGTGQQYVQLDLGAEQSFDSIRLKHFFNEDEARRYHDVVIMSSNDSSFSSGTPTILYNNDLDNSAGFGTGTDGEFVESNSGKIIDFDAVNARYVRFYSNGSTQDSSNHYADIRVGEKFVLGTPPTPIIKAEPDPEPTPTPTPTAIIVDNGDSQYTETGSWSLSGLTGQAGSSTKYGGHSATQNTPLRPQ